MDQKSILTQYILGNRTGNSKHNTHDFTSRLCARKIYWLGIQGIIQLLIAKRFSDKNHDNHILTDTDLKF